MWTETTRRQYRREDLRYASDMTDPEWALIEPHLPAAKPLGRPRCVLRDDDYGGRLTTTTLAGWGSLRLR